VGLVDPRYFVSMDISANVRSGRAAAILISGLASSCTAIEVDPLPAGVSAVAIVRNDKVLVDDFVPVMRAALEGRGIQTRLVADELAGDAGVIATYTARRSWDLAPYLSTADIWFRRDGEQIARLHYHLVGKGGLSMAKWDSTESKLTPAYEELLKAYARRSDGQ
jgi:hypothetical protein